MQKHICVYAGKTLPFGITDTIFDALANSVLAGQLESLTINKNRLTPWSLTTSNFDKFTNLRKLDLSDSYSMKDSGFKALAKSNSAHTLEYLNISRCGLTSLVEEDFRRFFNLKSLILRRNFELSSGSFSALAHSRIAHNLENLDIADCNIQAKDFIEENLNKLVNLKTLDVSYNEIGNEGFIALANSNIAPQLQELNISHNDIAPEIITEHRAKFRNIKEGKLLI